MHEIASKVSVIVPAHRNDYALIRCIQSLVALKPGPQEIIVVYNGPSHPPKLPKGVTLIRSHTPGAARARNIGASAASGDTLLFVDSDVLVPQDTVEKVQAFFDRVPEAGAVFGVYRDSKEGNHLSRIRNLFHRYTHLNAKASPSSFWTGLGAVKARTFRSIGGFDSQLRVLEDVEFGWRFYKTGHSIHIHRQLEAVHLKQWTCWTLLKCDIFDRAVPWTLLILTGRISAKAELNLSWSSRLSAALTVGTIFATVSAIFNLTSLLPASTLALLWLGVNRDVLNFYCRVGGVPLALGAGLWLWFYHLYCLVGFSFGLIAWVCGYVRERRSQLSGYRTGCWTRWSDLGVRTGEK